MSLTGDILAAKPGIKVGRVVSPAVLACLPKRLRAFFANLVIQWRKDREVWGLSFELDETTVQLGHFKGHHIATNPEVCGFSRELADEILRIEVEGVLLHELGHCIYTAFEHAGIKNLARRWAVALQSEGVASTYGAKSAPEGAAEAVRYFLMNPTVFQQAAPEQTRLILESMAAADDLLA